MEIENEDEPKKILFGEIEVKEYLTKREYFAAMALDAHKPFISLLPDDVDEVAKSCVRYADALIEELERTRESGGE